LKLLLVLNPRSRSGRGRTLWRGCCGALRRRGVGFDIMMCEPARSIAEAVRERDLGIYDAAVAVGGDGTINGVLDGLASRDDHNAALGVLYSGTSPDFCRFHGIPTEINESVEALVTGIRRRIDVAGISYRSAGGAGRRAHFGCSSNIGMGAQVARRSNRLRGSIGDTLGTATAVLATLARGKTYDLRIRLDGRELGVRRVNNLFVLKNPHIASGLHLDLGASANDGLLRVVCISGLTRAGLLRLLPSFYDGTALASPGVTIHQCREIEIEADERLAIEFDGDARGFLPARIVLRPSAIELVGSRHA